MKRPVFMVSDGTGITIESLANSLLSQFESIEFEKHVFPFIDTREKAEQVRTTIEEYQSNSVFRPLVFMTLVNPDVCNVIKYSNACVFEYLITLHTRSEENTSEL